MDLDQETAQRRYTRRSSGKKHFVYTWSERRETGDCLFTHSENTLTTYSGGDVGRSPHKNPLVDRRKGGSRVRGIDEKVDLVIPKSQFVINLSNTTLLGLTGTVHYLCFYRRYD